MELAVAKKLIRGAIPHSDKAQRWLDLGAGDGLFTKALGELLPAGSHILAIDKDERALKSISFNNTSCTFELLVSDFTSIPNTLPAHDGVLMANALHYVKDQGAFLVYLKNVLLKKSGALVLVEYDLEKPNAWVPYPVSKNRLALLALQADFALEIFSDSIRSKLNSSEIYCATLKP